ncbi:hypothetical protein T03_2966 [Trichinella britovi]|uniref:Uncharacterized protein n=1 Tax=Trichinella britovi TaxID=45882 RepID=A0A0V1CUH0_TRIBR|nr:hypothetical protein T03_2966 [Trichinella britovi]
MDDQLETAYEAKFSVLDMDVAKKAEGASKAAGPINEAEQKRQAELMKQASIAVQSALGEQASAAGRRVFFARHGERMDRKQKVKQWNLQWQYALMMPPFLLASEKLRRMWKTAHEIAFCGFDEWIATFIIELF